MQQAKATALEGWDRQQKVNVIDFSFFCGVDGIVIVIKEKVAVGV